ncbi:hypothetical protein [Bradyrhizobium erythrophlei]|uniref:Uncharacterized protein n=1 Tax=Bradyrhizobium erythrophlei TaxID=1437360 RepID=A0A1M5PTG2_9BRAD|nr:hypothetical protein [Bradyrhizobium erythrophlei]SHH05247.1 hypothetical protein SAMN05443248_3509 [Bradyrhizobium erythrophlei]
MKFCLRCDGARWVCEAHPDLPWEFGDRACTCGAPGEPCPACNNDAEKVPDMPPDFKVEEVRDFDPVIDVEHDIEEVEKELARMTDAKKRH